MLGVSYENLAGNEVNAVNKTDTWISYEDFPDNKSKCIK